MGSSASIDSRPSSKNSQTPSQLVHNISKPSTSAEEKTVDKSKQDFNIKCNRFNEVKLPLDVHKKNVRDDISDDDDDDDDDHDKEFYDHTVLTDACKEIYNGRRIVDHRNEQKVVNAFADEDLLLAESKSATIGEGTGIQNLVIQHPKQPFIRAAPRVVQFPTTPTNNFSIEIPSAVNKTIHTRPPFVANSTTRPQALSSFPNAGSSLVVAPSSLPPPSAAHQGLPPGYTPSRPVIQSPPQIVKVMNGNTTNTTNIQKSDATTINKTKVIAMNDFSNVTGSAVYLSNEDSVINVGDTIITPKHTQPSNHSGVLTDTQTPITTTTNVSQPRINVIKKLSYDRGGQDIEEDDSDVEGGDAEEVYDWTDSMQSVPGTPKEPHDELYGHSVAAMSSATESASSNRQEGTSIIPAQQPLTNLSASLSRTPNLVITSPTPVRPQPNIPQHMHMQMRSNLVPLNVMVSHGNPTASMDEEDAFGADFSIGTSIATDSKRPALVPKLALPAPRPDGIQVQQVGRPQGLSLNVAPSVVGARMAVPGRGLPGRGTPTPGHALNTTWNNNRPVPSPLHANTNSPMNLTIPAKVGNAVVPSANVPFAAMTTGANSRRVLSGNVPQMGGRGGPSNRAPSVTTVRTQRQIGALMGQAPPEASPAKPTVKETTDVKRNRALLPSNTSHPQPVSGDWLKKRYIVNNYILLDVLGTGSYGEVRMCRDRTESEGVFAMKIISKDFLKKKKNGHTSETYFEDIRREIAIMKLLLHPNILRLYEVLDDPKVNKIYLVLEYMKKGDLAHFLKEKDKGSGKVYSQNQIPPMSEQELWNVFRQVVQGIKYLHLQNVVHGDIKPQNILVGEDGIIKIADFGISKMMSGSSQKLADAAGTPAFMSPEICELTDGAEFSGQLADVWALGATMFMLRFGHPPFIAGSLINLYVKIQTEPLAFPYPIDALLQDLLEKMLIKDPAKRISLPQVISHKWFERPPPPPVMSTPMKSGMNNSNAIDRTPTSKTVDTGSSDMFLPPASYDEEQAKAMAAPLPSLNNEDIFRSIGVGMRTKTKLLRKTPSKAVITEYSQDTGQVVVDKSEEDIHPQHQKISEDDSNIMATGWGEDVFDRVEDEFDDDSADGDEVVDDDGDGDVIEVAKPKSQLPLSRLTTNISANKQSNFASVKPPLHVSIVGQEAKDESMESNGSNHAAREMDNSEEAERIKRFRARQSKASMNNLHGNEKSNTGSRQASPMSTSVPSYSDMSNLKMVSDKTLVAHGQQSGIAVSPSMSQKMKPPTPLNVRIEPKAIESESSRSVISDDDIEKSTTLSGAEFDTLMDSLQVDSNHSRIKNIVSNTPCRSSSSSSNLSVVAAVCDTIPEQFLNKVNGIGIVHASVQGMRTAQEDRYIAHPDLARFPNLPSHLRYSPIALDSLKTISVAGLFDGHGGEECANYLEHNLVKAILEQDNFLAARDIAVQKGFEALDEHICGILRTDEDESGSTASVIVYEGRSRTLTIANVGDSLCVLSKGGNALSLLPVHRPSDPTERRTIELGGGKVIKDRVNGILAVSRSFGDARFKAFKETPGIVTAKPDVVTEIITDIHEFAVIASDGLWDVLDPHTVVTYIRKRASKRHNLQLIVNDLTELAVSQGSMDNVTVVVMVFNLSPLDIASMDSEDL